MSWMAGFHAVRQTLATDPGRARGLYYLKGRRDGRVQELIGLAKTAGVRFQAVDRSWLDARSEGPHQGVLLFCESGQTMDEPAFEQLMSELARPCLLLVLDGVTDPRNFGACLRSAAAAGVQAVLVPERNSAPLSDVALKTAAGAAEIVPVVRVKNLARRLDWLKGEGVWLVGADAEGANLWSEVDLTANIAIVMGDEGKGLRRLTRDKCDHLVRIATTVPIGSLNVSVATGVLLFEARRQRLATEAGAS